MLWDPNKDRPVEVELDTVSSHLLRAIDYIKQHGWCQGKFKTPDGAVCILGSLLETGGIISTIRAITRTEIGLIAAPNWNDNLSPLNGKAEVIDVLRTAAYKGGINK